MACDKYLNSTFMFLSDVFEWFLISKQADFLYTMDLIRYYYYHYYFLQLGQALSTRPDILPSAYCQELSKLQVSRIQVN